MKNRIDNLYFGKIRHCVMDIIMDFSLEGKKIEPRPDYFEYYTIILKSGDNYMDLFDKNNKLELSIDSTNIENYQSDLIIWLEPLKNYLDIRDKLSTNELDLALNIITKTKNLENKYGYKNRIIK